MVSSKKRRGRPYKEWPDDFSEGSQLKLIMPQTAMRTNCQESFIHQKPLHQWACNCGCFWWWWWSADDDDDYDDNDLLVILLSGCYVPITHIPLTFQQFALIIYSVSNSTYKFTGFNYFTYKCYSRCIFIILYLNL